MSHRRKDVWTCTKTQTCTTFTACSLHLRRISLILMVKAEIDASLLFPHLTTMTPDCRTSPHKRVVPPDVKMSNNILFLTTALTHNYLADKHKIALICEKRARSTLSWRIFKFGSVNSIQNLSLYCCIEVIGARLGKHLPKLSPGSHTHLDAVSCKRRLREQLRCVMSSKGTGADFLCSSRTPRFPPPPLTSLLNLQK